MSTGSEKAAQFKDQGNKYLQAKQYDEAVRAYTEAINLNPFDHVYFSNRSAAYLSKGDNDHALIDAERCIKLNASWPKGYSRRGAALHAMRKYNDAIAAYEEGLKIAPTDQGLKDGLAEVQRAKEGGGFGGGGAGGARDPMGGLFGPQMLAKLVGHPKFGPKLADPTFMAKLQMAQKNPQVLMSDPELMEVLQVLLGVGAEGGDGPAGSNDFPSPPQSSSRGPSTSSSTKESEKKPVPEPEIELNEEERTVKQIRDNSNSLKEKGNNFYKNKQFQEALSAYDEAFSADTTNVMILNNKAAVYIEMNDIEKAIETCQEVLDKASSVKLSFDDRAKVYQRIAAAHLKRDDIPSAIASYGKAQMEKYDKTIDRKMKNLELEQKKKAREQYINPELGAEAKERGNAAFRDGNFPTAITEYEEACKRDPKNPAYHNNLAAAYLKMGAFNDAKREVEVSLEIDKKYVKAWAKKGDIEFFMKEYHKALDSYQHGLNLEADNSLCKQGLQKTMAKIQEANMTGGHDKERAAHAMADPEIQAILMDPSIRQVLTDFQENPKFAQQAMGDPDIRKKIEKLIAAGVLQVK
jgi:stress-induced-phosphoprotein 1